MKEKTLDRFDQLLEFKTIFPNEKPLNPSDYLKGGNRSVILRVATFFLSFKNHDSKYQDSKKTLETIFGTENNRFANEVYIKIKGLEKEKTKVSIINPQSSLELFEYFFQKGEEEETQTPSEFEINFFKAYLVFNSRFTAKQLTAFSSTKDLKPNLHLPLMFFCSSYAYTDKVNYNLQGIWITQIVKAVLFFKFLESKQETKFLLSKFLEYFNCSSWQEYLQKLLPLTSTAIQNEKESQIDIVVANDNDFLKNVSFIEKLVLIEDDKLNENDFLTLRASPFYKIKDGVYRIIFNLFVVEKIFKGIYFLLRDINNKLQKQVRIPEFKSFYGYEFSEKILLYQIMNLIYQVNCVRFTGERLSQLGINGAPDYYIRKGKNILIFESKDFLIPASAKVSFDFNVYKEEFEKKLFYKVVNNKEKPKAIRQLIGSIRKILNNDFSADKDYKYREVSIYPILITHDHQYDAPGFNILINSWFQDELNILTDEGFYTNRIKPLVIINIDSLIYHQVVLSKNIPLHVLMNIYENQTKINNRLIFKTSAEATNYFLSKSIPFSVFADRFINNKGLSKMPPLISEIAQSIFKVESMT